MDAQRRAAGIDAVKVDTLTMTIRQKQHTDAGDAPTKGGANAKRKPLEIKWHLNTVPEVDGEVSAFVGSLPVEDDPESYIEAKESVEAGQLCRIVKGDGRGKIITSYRYRKLGDDGRVVALELEADETDEAAAPLAGGAPLLTLADAHSIADEAVRRAMAKEVERTQASAPSVYAQAEEFQERVDRIIERRDQDRKRLLEELRAEVARQNPATKRGEGAPADGESLLYGAMAKMAENDPKLAEKIAEHVFPAREDGFLSTVGRSVAESVLSDPQTAQMAIGAGGAIVQQLLSGLGSIFKRAPVEGVAQAADAPEGAPMPSTVQAEQPDPMFAMLEPARGLIEFVAVALANNEDHAPALKAIAQATENNPQLGLGLAALAQMSSIEVVSLLARFTGQPILIKLKHGAEWVEILQGELRGDADEEADEDAPELVPVASNNGTRAHDNAFDSGARYTP
jgi:hypothetical protein